MTNRTNPQHGANMVDRYIGSAFDIVYAVYKELDKLPAIYQFAIEYIPRVEKIDQDYQDILERYENILIATEVAENSASNAAESLSQTLEFAQQVALNKGETEAFMQAAQSAASSASESAEQAESTVLQAVQDVVDGVDGQVDRAEDAADRAETARDAAFVNADVYPDVATGRAAVADGEQFQVVEGDEIVRYRRDSASEQTEVARYPSAALARSGEALARAAALASSVAAGADYMSYPLPLALPVSIYPPGGTVLVSPADATTDSALALDTKVNSTSSGIWAIRVGNVLEVGEIVRVTATLANAFEYTPAPGILVGDASNVLGFAMRSTGQLLTLHLPSGVTGSVTGPTGRGFSVGDTLSIDVRLLGGEPGNYTVRYFVEYPDGDRRGPYDVSGIGSLNGLWFGARSRSNWHNIRVQKFKVPVYADELLKGNQESTNIVYVSTTGSDSNSGTLKSPFKTIARAVSELSGGGIIEVFGGEYREALNINSPYSYWMRSRAGERAVILGSDRLAVSKTPGYSQVYQAPLASKPTGIGGSRGQPVIFEWGTPSKPIPVSECHPMHRGATHRLPYTEMFEAESLAVLDTPEGRGAWWWDSGTIYFSATDGGDATLKRYEARSRRTLQHHAGSIRLSRMDIMFSNSHGVSFNGHSATTEDVQVFGSHFNGFYHQSGVWNSRRDRAGGNGNDGFNGTITAYSTPDDSGTRITGIFYDPYGHDNGDDGISYHYRGDQTTYGGLFEYNTKADVVHVTGAAVTCYGTTARGTNIGFYAADLPAGDSARAGTILRCVDTVAIGNNRSYYSRTEAVLECVKALAQDPGWRGYSTGDGGQLLATDCRYIGKAGREKEGDVVVVQSELLA